jgi:protein O-GlcNAc transferase
LSRARTCLLKDDAAAARLHCQSIHAKDAMYADSLRLTALSWAVEDNMEEGVRLLSRALGLRPDQSVWHRDLGIMHGASGHWGAASRAFRKASALNPGDYEALHLYARSLAERGRYHEALTVYNRAGHTFKATPEFLRNRASLLFALRNLEEAAADLSRSFELEPDSLSGHELMADCQKYLTNYEHAMVHRQLVVKLNPSDSQAVAELALAHFDLGEIEKSEHFFRRALELGPLAPHAHSIFLNALLHHPSSTASSLLEEHRRWAELYCPPANRQAFRNVPDARRRLRVGYITGQFISVPTCHFFLPVFLNHDPAVCETFCYHARPTYDPRTEEYRRAAAHWQDVQTGSDEQVAARIRRDRIDILVDLSGHYP